MRAILALGVLTGMATAASAQVPVAYWRFPTTVPAGGDNFKITFPLAADSTFNPGPALITSDALQWDGTAAPPAAGQGNFQYFSGSAINSLFGDVAGSGLSLRSGTAGASNNKQMTFQFNSTGFTDLTFSYAERVTTTGPTNVAVSVSTDGVNFTLVPALNYALTDRDSTFRRRVVDFSAVDSIEGQSAAYIRLTFTGFSTSSATGAIRMDNVVIIPTPAAAALLGLGGLVGFRRRR